MPEKEFRAEVFFGGKIEPRVHASFEKFHKQLEEAPKFNCERYDWRGRRPRLTVGYFWYRGGLALHQAEYSGVYS